MKKKILELDKKYLWHPFTPIKTNAPIPIASAKNEFLYDVDGKRYVDLISSWWVNIHGHCNEYIYKRLSKLSDLKCYVQKHHGVILFSPSGSSYDMFRDYIDRGNKFDALINKCL